MSPRCIRNALLLLVPSWALIGGGLYVLVQVLS